jgi:hypothetical protein
MFILNLSNFRQKIDRVLSAGLVAQVQAARPVEWRASWACLKCDHHLCCELATIAARTRLVKHKIPHCIKGPEPLPDGPWGRTRARRALIGMPSGPKFVSIRQFY